MNPCESGSWTPQLKEAVDAAYSELQSYGFSREFIERQVQLESSGCPTAYHYNSPLKGGPAYGAFQFQLGTARLHLPQVKAEELYDPAVAVKAYVGEMKRLLQMAQQLKPGQDTSTYLSMVAAGYHGGEGNMRAAARRGEWKTPKWNREYEARLGLREDVTDAKGKLIKASNRPAKRDGAAAKAPDASGPSAVAAVMSPKADQRLVRTGRRMAVIPVEQPPKLSDARRASFKMAGLQFGRGQQMVADARHNTGVCTFEAGCDTSNKAQATLNPVTGGGYKRKAPADVVVERPKRKRTLMEYLEAGRVTKKESNYGYG